MAALDRPCATRPSTSRSRTVRGAKRSRVAVRPRRVETTSGSRTVPPPPMVASASTRAGTVEDTVLEQVAEPARVGAGNCGGRPSLDRLGQQQQSHVGPVLPQPTGGLGSLARPGRRHPHVDYGNVGSQPFHRLLQGGRVTYGRDHLDTGFLEQAGQALAPKRRIVGDHDPHGSPASTRVPPEAVALTPSWPPTASTRSARPRSPRPLASAPPQPSSSTRSTRPRASVDTWTRTDDVPSVLWTWFVGIDHAPEIGRLAVERLPPDGHSRRATSTTSAPDSAARARVERASARRVTP